MRNAKLALGILTGAIILGCSPVSRLRVSFTLPKSAGAIDYAKLHVRARVACNSFNLADPKPADPQPPLPGPEEKDEDEVPPLPIDDASSDAGASDAAAADAASSDAGDAGNDLATPRYRSRNQIRAVSLSREGEFFHISERASSCRAAGIAWYDTNGNGLVDRGDFHAVMPLTKFHDRGLCAGNLTTVGPLELKPQ